MKHRALLLFFSKKRQLVSPLLSLDYRRTATVGSYWGGMGEALFFFFLKSQVKKIVYETLEYYSQNIKTKKR